MPALSEPFVPGRGRRVALAAAGISVGLFGVVAWLLPGPDEGGDWRLGDRLMMWGLGLAIAALMARYARIGAWPFASGLRVRNLLLTREIPWAEIEDVRFGGGEPWVQLELIDGETLAVMAIQRADGPRGQGEAERLAALVAERQRPAE